MAKPRDPNHNPNPRTQKTPPVGGTDQLTPIEQLTLTTSPGPDPNTSEIPEIAAQALRAVAMLRAAGELLCNTDPGYVRIVPSADDQVFHLTYTYRYGKWKGHYVYVVAQSFELAQGLIILARKVDEVSLGIRKPTVDAMAYK